MAAWSIDHARKTYSIPHWSEGFFDVDEQGRGVGERLVVEQQPWIDVPVRRDQRQIAHGLIQPAGDRPDPGLGRKQPVGVQGQAGRGGHVRIVVAVPQRGKHQE